MKTRKFLWALLPVAAVLLMTACGGDDTDDVTPTPTPNPVTPGTENVVKSVPYTVTVKTADVTRTSVDNDDITLRFEGKDLLYVQNDGGTVYGCLELKSGVGETSATFAGTVNYTGSTPPDADTQLTATLVGEGNELVTIDTDGKVQPVTYSNDDVCASMEEAVSKYSWISGKGKYGEAVFELAQKTAFMKFSVTIQDGTGPNKEVPVKITLGTDDYEFTKTTTGSQFDAEISFVLPLAAGTEIAGDASMCVANVGDDDESIRIGTGTNVTLAGGNVYPVTRTKDFVRLWANGPLWSTRNIGATNVTDYGDYYQWGETEPVTNGEDCNWNSSYKFWAEGTTNDDVKFTKYVPTGYDERWGNTEITTPDNKDVLEAVDDVATKKLGSPWHMPTDAEFSNLLTNTNINNEWTTDYSVNGRIFTGTGDYEGKALFLPAAGAKRNTGISGQNSAGLYWSSSLALNSSSISAFSRDLVFTNNGTIQVTNGPRYQGRPVRAICTN